jgi:HEPN domain-containing protein
MSDSRNYEEWIEMAQKDLKAARLLFKHEGLEELVAFHCQQAVEKYLKAFLIKKTGVLHSGHYLVGLLKKCYKIDKNFKKFINQVAFLNSYYIETRYPAAEGLILDQEDVRKCIEYATQILDYTF